MHWKYAVAFSTRCGTRVGANSPCPVTIVNNSRASSAMGTARTRAYRTPLLPRIVRPSVRDQPWGQTHARFGHSRTGRQQPFGTCPFSVTPSQRPRTPPAGCSNRSRRFKVFDLRVDLCFFLGGVPAWLRFHALQRFLRFARSTQRLYTGCSLSR